jgi:hypothetical protein
VIHTRDPLIRRVVTTMTPPTTSTGSTTTAPATTSTSPLHPRDISPFGGDLQGTAVEDGLAKGRGIRHGGRIGKLNVGKPSGRVGVSHLDGLHHEMRREQAPTPWDDR